MISSNTGAKLGKENTPVPSNLGKLTSYFKLEIQTQSLLYGLLHVSSGRNEGWLDSIINSNCDIPQNRFQTDRGFNFKL